jgi:hypothetical protein
LAGDFCYWRSQSCDFLPKKKISSGRDDDDRAKSKNSSSSPH